MDKNIHRMKTKMDNLEFLKKIRFPVVISSHIILLIFAYYLSFAIRFDLAIPPHYVTLLLKTLPAILALKFIVYYYFGLFHSSIRFASVFDFWQIIKANTIASVIFILIISVFFREMAYPRSVYILNWVFCIVLIGGIRLIGRLSREKIEFTQNLKHTKILIIGTGEAGILVLKECRINPCINYNVIGFIDDESSKNNLTIQGVRILGRISDIPKIVQQYHIEEIIIATPSAKGKDIRNIINFCQTLNIKIKIVPGMRELISDDLRINLREIRPEDLLGREAVKTNKNEIENYIQFKNIIITGAGGSIGSELARQAIDFFPQQIILIDNHENDLYFLELELKEKYPNLQLKTIVGDIKDISLLKYVFSTYRPQIVFHAAAFKHVPLMEKNVASAVQNNIIGSRNLMYASEHYGVESFVLISTDKAVNPTSVMGTSKRITEMILQAKSKNSRTKFIAVRFGNVLGSKGSVVPLFKQQIEHRLHVTVTHPEAKRFFMSVKEAVELVLQASTMGKGGEIFMIDMGEQIKIVDLAKNLITLSGLEPEKEIAIKYIGLRPGEKLFEETLHDTEKNSTTKHDKISVTKPNNFNPQKLRKQIKKLEDLIKYREETKIIEMLKEIVPSYNPQKNQ